MRFILNGSLVAFLALVIQPASAAVVSKIVGKVGDYFVTSRESIGVRLLERELFPSEKLNIVEDVNSQEFVMLVTSALLEKVVAVEAESFSVAAVADDEVRELAVKAKKHLAGVRLWQRMDFSSMEVQEMILRKLRSKRFLKYKTESSSLTVTDFEVKDYYEKSRYKFGNLPFESFKENIRQFLIQKQTEDRLREWFEVLRKKYQVRNFLAEG